MDLNNEFKIFIIAGVNWLGWVVHCHGLISYNAIRFCWNTQSVQTESILRSTPPLGHFYLLMRYNSVQKPFLDFVGSSSSYILYSVVKAWDLEKILWYTEKWNILSISRYLRVLVGDVWKRLLQAGDHWIMLGDGCNSCFPCSGVVKIERKPSDSMACCRRLGKKWSIRIMEGVKCLP